MRAAPQWQHPHAGARRGRLPPCCLFRRAAATARSGAAAWAALEALPRTP